MGKSAIIAVVGVLLLLSGCTAVGYYGQAVSGHMKIMHAARPIQEMQQDPATDPALKEKFSHVLAIRDFASRELGLPENGSYRSYADLGRPFVVWNVFAAPEFSVEPEKWCMAVVGCVNYRGYFDRAEAERYAAELKNAGIETHVGGVAAYSTLGYFDDPVLNTFLRLGNTEAARIIFHELAHQLLFVKGDTLFNESFATAVEQEGMQRWFARNSQPEQHKAYLTQQKRKNQFVQLVESYRGKLRTLYSSGKPQDEMRRTKAETLADMKRAYAALKQSWDGDSRYDKWFEQDLNNARIASQALYTQLLPAFEAMLEQEGRDLPRFYRRVQALAKQPKEERLAALNTLVK
ncbi:MAG: aminopeptidase [Gallionellaceae bacterium]|nr:aminopeptidase [Gallionellaceae bacterium]